jgi:SSS family solute:Na+ symporter
MATQFQVIDWIILVVYFGAMAAMGPYFARKNKTTENYFLGGRSFPGWLIGLSMFATSISSITFVAYPADAYKTAYLRFLLCLMLPVGVFLASIIFLPYFRRARITSAFEYLEGRFGPKTRMYAALVFIAGQVMRLSLILYLVSLLVQEMTGLNAYWSILIGGIVTSIYTVMGGIEAVIWTDFFQSFLLWGGGLLCLLMIIFTLDGGLATIIREGVLDNKFVFGDPDPVTKQITPAPWGFSLWDKTVIMLLLVGLNNWLTEYSSNQNVIQKYVSTKNPKEALKAIWICVLCSVPTWGFFMFLGTALYVFFKLNPDPKAAAMLTGEGGAKADSILPYFVVEYLPQGLTGLVIAGVLAAAMSSLSSSINAISAVGIVDVYKRHMVKNRDERHYLRAARGVSIVASILMLGGATLLMMAQSLTLQDTATKLTALFAGGLLGLYCLGFLTKRGDGRAVAVGIVCTLIFTAYMTAVQSGWITVEGYTAFARNLVDWGWMTEERFQAYGIPEFAGRLANPMDMYYAGIFGNIIMFVVAYVVAALFQRKQTRDLTNLTVWTRDNLDEDGLPLGQEQSGV